VAAVPVTPWVTKSIYDGTEASWTNIPPREWLYGVDLVRGEATVVASPGGVGKSAFVIGMVMSLAFEKDLLGETIWDTDHKVLYINGEDPHNEVRRRTAAFGMLHNITEQDMKDRLFIVGTDSWQMQHLMLLRTERQLSVIDENGFTHLENFLASKKLSVVVIDPLISFCGGNVNDNAAMGQVMRRLKQLAAKYHCAMVIVHHNRKGGDLESQEAVSGAAATVNLSRRTIATIRMTPREANELGVLPSECWRYFRVVVTKTNMSPPTSNGNTAWYEMVSVSLGNANAIYKSGDKVHAVKRAKFTPANNVQLTVDDKIIRRAILDVVQRGKIIDGETHQYSPKTTGAKNQRSVLDDAKAAVRQAVPHNQWAPGDLKAIVTRAVNRMLTDGWLIDEEIQQGRFRRRRGLRVDWPRTHWPNKEGDGSAGPAHDQRVALQHGRR
jgi:KaiC/GvpD/RAD55 family RecA-like ATPase